ncbi:nuclear transport factor 2 family protein [Hymenobacter sp. P5252]|uniref:Nuclear transport factor 2 family protein n=1 Tax=Hymenobacter terrestris TaxID=2748310 RepID=A0ABX2Q6Z9_9BACT|nr:nuclear transport factor 2 family protein [Hymenobacter terrestris]
MPFAAVHEHPPELIRQAYAGFNARNIPAVLATLHPQVRWSLAWEGDYATGHDEVRAYWQRQWQELDPQVEPTSVRERPDGRLEVAVHQVVKDKQGTLLFEGPVKHVYTLRDGLLQQMDIEQV